MNIVGLSEYEESLGIKESAVKAIFSQLPRHWKDTFFQDFQIIFVSRRTRRSRKPSVRSPFTLVYVLPQEKEILPDSVYLDILREYLRHFIHFNDMAKLVEDISCGIITPYPETKEERADFELLLNILVVYVLDTKGAYGANSQYAELCEEIDRQVRGRYVPGVLHGLLVC